MKRIVSLATFLLGFGCLLFAQKPQMIEKPKDALHFLVVGDWGRNGEYNQKTVATQMGRIATEFEPEFIISTGDNFYPNGVASTQDPHWQVSFENVYTAHALMEEWYVTLGNHDYRGNVQAQIDYTNVSRRWVMPARYYSFEHELENGDKALFVFMDTNPFQKKYYTEPEYADRVAGQDTTAQRIWVEQTLANSTAKWKIVVGHHPLYTTGKRISEPQDMKPAFENIFERNKVNVYFCGHEHSLQHQKPKNIHYFVSGAGSKLTTATKADYTKFSVAEHGFMIVSLTGEQMLVQVVNEKGKVLYKATVKP